jgi:hypothetical protein
MKILGIVGSNRKKGNSYLLFKCNINQLLLFNCVQRPIVTFDSNLFACFDKEIFGKDVKNETEFRTGVRLNFELGSGLISNWGQASQLHKKM